MPQTPASGERAFRFAAYCAQFFFGGWFLVHGLNHWFHFFPQPPGSSPQGAALIGALIESGMFDLIKAMEVVTGALMLANRLVPLAIVLAFPVGVGIAAFDHSTNGDLFGTGTAVAIMLMLGLMALSHLERFLPMLSFNQGEPSLKGWRQLTGQERKED
jgi:uncharacterized membrane protein YphA (DoxX/SURF4 family)